jgi:hypothetical protein
MLERVGGGRVALQLVTIMAGAALAGAASLAYSEANGIWQQALRGEVARSNALQETVRAVYGDEAPDAFRIAVLEIRADTLRRLGERNRLAVSQREVAEQTGFALRRAAHPDSLAGDHQFALPAGGADVPRRLADLTAQQARRQDPDALAADGDTAARLGGRIALVTIVVTAAAIVTALVPRRRRRGLHRNETAELIPQPGITARRHRRTSGLLLAAWAAAVLLPFGQLAFSAEEQRSQSRSARSAVQLTSDLAISLTRSSFQTQARRIAAEISMEATAREIGALSGGPVDAASERAVARAEEAAASRSAEVAAAMSRDPRRQDGLSPREVAALVSREQDWKALAARQRAQADRADRFGGWSNTTVVLIAIVVAAGAMVQASTARR